MKQDIKQLSENDHKEITSREATLRKYRADPKQKDAARKRQLKSCVNQKHKIQENEEYTEAKLLKKL